MPLKLLPFWTVRQGDCVEVMRSMDECSVDAIVTDPPYDLISGSRNGSGRSNEKDVFGRHGPRGGGFMGLHWDSTGIAFNPETWVEALRVLKPGGHALVFGGTRTYHRVMVAIEDAGFEIRDCIQWLYGSGFPKSKNVALSIDKGEGLSNRGHRIATANRHHPDGTFEPNGESLPPYEARSEKAQGWEGWGTALKPAYEPIVLARKPLSGTVAKNVLEHGTGALNIDGCRVVGIEPHHNYGRTSGERSFVGASDVPFNTPSGGRWPANVILTHHPDCEVVGTRMIKGDPRDTGNGRRGSGFVNVGADSGDGEPNARVYGDAEVEVFNCHPDCPVRILDEQTGTLTSGKHSVDEQRSTLGGNGQTHGLMKGVVGAWHGDSGGASRFFYCSKASTKERNAGLDERNGHPTVKPIELMRYLIRLVTPPGGLVLDPFMGSGTTLIAATLEGFDSVGIDQDEGYCEIARQRCEHWEEEGK